MRVNGASDLARMQMLQRRATDTKGALDEAAIELMTGQKSSRFKATGGNLTRLFAIERSMARMEVFSSNLSVLETRVDVMQSALGLILEPTSSLAIDLSESSNLGDLQSSLLHADVARNTFEDSIGLLNTQVAGQSLFAGTATDSAAMAPAADILAALDAIAAGAPDAATAIAGIEAYFTDPTGAFFGAGYIGATDDLTPVEVGEGQNVDYGVRGDNAQIVATLQAQAIAAVVSGGAFAGNNAEQLAMLSEAGAQLLAAKEGMLDLRADVGINQERIEVAQAARTAEYDTLDLARAEIVGVDELEAASVYQALEVQLEAIYTVTSRISNLRFSNFMG